MKLNSNCLLGYKCPNCGSQGPFEMTTTSTTKWCDDGTEYQDTPSIADEGFSTCLACGKHGETREFDAEKNYVEQGGNHCPYCNDEDIQSGSFDVEGPNAYQEVMCNKCGAGWQDHYKLVGINNFPDEDFVLEDKDE